VSGERQGRHDQEEAGPLVLWARWVRAGILAQLTPLEGKVGMVLAAFASRKGRAFPAASTVAALIGTKRTRVYAAERRLVELKVFERIDRVPRASRKPAGPVIYQLLPPPICPSQGDTYSEPRAGCSHKGDGGVPYRGRGESAQRDGGSPSQGDTQCLLKWFLK
jgi:hypothetical protein